MTCGQPSPFRQATIAHLDDQTLEHIIQLVTRHLEQWAVPPTPAQVRAAIVTVPTRA